MILVAGEALQDERDGGSSGGRLLAMLESHPALAAPNQAFLSGLPADSNARVSQDGQRQKCIIVLQGEVACVDTRAEAEHSLWVGSEDATTCVIAVAECAATGLLAAAHFDESTATEACAAQLVAGMRAPVLYLCGGYADSKGTGANVAGNLLSALHHNALSIEIRLACVGQRNTSANGTPLARDLLFEQHTKRTVPLRMNLNSSDAEPLPAFTLRDARQWLSEPDRLHELYDSEDGTIVVKRFPYTLDSHRARFFEYCLNMPSELILHLISTSPQDERPGFVEVKRSSFKWILEHPNDDSFFTSDEVRYDWDAGEGRWVQRRGASVSQSPQPTARVSTFGGASEKAD